jgi:hypothetical protein
MTYQAVGDVIDETLEALACLDVDRLAELEERIGLLAESDTSCGGVHTDSILAKKRALEVVLKNSEENLKALHRLHGRNMGTEWVR